MMLQSHARTRPSIGRAYRACRAHVLLGKQANSARAGCAQTAYRMHATKIVLAEQQRVLCMGASKVSRIRHDDVVWICIVARA